MAPRRVRPDEHDEIGVVEIVVTHGHHVFAEGALVPRHGRCHAQARVGVDVGRAHVALHELVGDVIVFGQELAGHIEGHGFRAVFADAVAECRGHRRDRVVPAHSLAAHLRMQQAILETDGLTERVALHAQLAAIGRMGRIAAHAHLATFLRGREHATAHAAVGTGSSSRSAGTQALGSGRRVEQQLVAYRTDVCLVGDQVAQARSLAHVAEQDGAADLVALENHSLVDAAAIIREHQ